MTGPRPPLDATIIVPFADAARYIERCVTALLAQTYPAGRYEIIMVDNNSTDGSSAIVSRYPRVRLVAERTPGAYAARNRGRAEARGAILAFTDADCAPAPDWLETMAAALEDARASVALGRVVNRPSLCLSLLSAYEHERALYIFGGATPELYYGYTNNMAVRRAVFERVGRFDEVARGADVVFVRRVVDAESPDAVRYEATAVVEHLEIGSVWAWWRKMFIYGRSSRYYRSGPPTRALTNRERREVLRGTIRARGLSIAARALLSLLLGVGVGLHLVGRWTAIRRSPMTPADMPERQPGA
jgi:glycosyltransferase involved in cell wall biosynthesis